MKREGTIGFGFRGWVRSSLEDVEIFDLSTNSVKLGSDFEKGILLEGLRSGNLLINRVGAVLESGFDGNTEVDDFDVDLFED